MNNKFKRALSSVLAFIMLLSCMTVMNVSSVLAAVDTTSIDNSTTTVWNLLGATATVLTDVSGTGSSQDTVKYLSSGAGYKVSSDYTSENTGVVLTADDVKAPKFNAVNQIEGKAHIEVPAKSGDVIYVYAYGNSSSSTTSNISFIPSTSYSDAGKETKTFTSTRGNVNEVSYTVPADFEGTTIYIIADSAGGSNTNFAAVARVRANGGEVTDPTESTTEASTELTTEAPTETTTSAPVLTGISLVDELSFSANETFESETNVGNFTIMPAASGTAVSVDTSKKTANGNEATHRLKLGGTGSTTNRAIKLTTAVDDTTLYIWALSSSSSTDRSLTVSDADGNKIGSVNAPGSGDPIPGGSVKLPTAGTYYVYSPSSGVNIYLIGTDKALVPVTTEVSSETTTEAATESTTAAPVSSDYSYTVSDTGSVNDGTLNISGSLKTDQSIQGKSFTLTTKGKATVTLKLASSASGARTITVTDTASASVDTIEIPANSNSAEYEITLNAADTYTFSCTSEFKLYSVSIKYDAGDTPVTKPVTVTVYDSTTGNKVTGKIYYWVTLAAAGTTNELNISDGNGIIPVTEIAAGTYTPSGSIVANTSAATDMTDAITNGVLYVSAEGYAGAEVKLPASGNVNVQLVPLPTVNISEAGVYSVNAGKIVEALLASGTADYSYQNPYIKSAEVNGFKMTAAGNNQVIKVMPKVNTRNQTRDSLVQLSKGCTIEYTPSTSGQLTIAAASPNSSTTRGYAVDGTTTTPNSVTLTSTASASSTFALTKDTPCTITITNTVDGDDGGINIYSIEFVPDEVQKYPVTLNVTGDTLGTTTVNVNDAALSSGTAYDEYSTVSITAVPSGDNKVAVTVNGVTVSLTDNAYTFTLTGETTIAVAYSENEIEVTDKLLPLTVGETIDFTTASLTAKNESYVTVNGENKVKYFADAVSGGGKTSDIKLQANNATNYVEIIAGSDGNLAVTFNGNDIRVTGSDGSTQILSRSDVSANNDVMRTIKVTEGVTYTITALTDSDKTSGANVGNAYISAVSLLAATVEAGKNITTIYATEEINDAEILAAYNASGADRYVRIIGQLNGITDSNATSVDEVGFVILNCSYADWENAGFADTNLQGEIKVSTVYPDVYSSTGFDSSKVADNGTYTGTTLNLSGLNTYFDTLVYGSDADFTGTYIYTFTEIDGTRYYYNSNAELTEKTF